MLAYKLGIYLIVGRNPSAAGTFMFELSINCVSRRKFLLQALLKCWLYREDLHSVLFLLCSHVIASPSTSVKRAYSSALWPVFVIFLGVTQSMEERKILDEVGTLCYKLIRKTWLVYETIDYAIESHNHRKFSCFLPRTTFHGFSLMMGIKSYAEQTQKFCVLTHLF